VILVPVRNGNFGKPKAFSLRDLDIAPNPNFQNGMYASYVQSSSGRYLAVNLDYRNEVVFYELRRNGANAVNLVRWESRSRSAKTPLWSIHT